MCWLAVDRALRLARLTGRPEQESWSVLADRISAEVLEHGWKAEVRSFTAAYDGLDLDAAALQIGLCGLLPADDERFAATVEAVELRLREGPTVYRYRSDDGLPGSEGGFHLCALWLAHAYALVGPAERRAGALRPGAGAGRPHRTALRAVRPARRARARQPPAGLLAPRR